MTDRRADLPVPLVVAAAGAALEALALLALAVLELVNISALRITMGASTAVFFLMYGVGLMACAAFLLRRAPWARAPIILTQLIQLGTAWSFTGGSTTLVAVVLAVLAVVVLVGVLHPASTAALIDDPTGEGRD
ncbi:hypothetical protein [Nocardioides sp. zg-DK7169]|uniref:hypothetical protein n=1 Tax=Nocardioides sp. zg-DK7169 TaxID=2736600 RepID=UPI0015555630|nr:hypothetical protein [Nocardioides sp. zg-DK7169]NPC96131.1 hypothetical protein [Nocardioides sp. zg-DK7169]